MANAAKARIEAQTAESLTSGRRNRSRLLPGFRRGARKPAALTALLLTNGKSKTPACEVTAASSSDSITAFLMPRPARPNRERSICKHQIYLNEIALGRGTHAAIRANGNVFRLAPQTGQQLKKSEGRP
jgi:hypothetical protein